MKYFVMATKVDETDTEASLDDFPEDYPIESFEFLEGEKMIPKMTEPLVFQFSDDYPEGRKLIDLQHNSDGLHVVSSCFRSLLEGEAQIEFIPVVLLDHRGRVASEEYTISNFLDALDCLDWDKSDVKMNAIDPDSIFSISKLVLNEQSISGDVNIFRIKQCMTTVIVKESLKDKIEAAGINGPLFVPIEEFKSYRYLGV
jgi:hypothetical protein